jgi:hypothetical protein
LGRNGKEKKDRTGGKERVKESDKKREIHPKGIFFLFFSPFPILMPWFLPLASLFIPKTL